MIIRLTLHRCGFSRYYKLYKVRMTISASLSLTDFTGKNPISLTVFQLHFPTRHEVVDVFQAIFAPFCAFLLEEQAIYREVKSACLRANW